MSINFAHIYPTAFLHSHATEQKVHLCLAHLVETDLRYVEFYANLPKDHKIILDNSAFEMYKQGREMYPSDKLIEMGRQIDADIIVLSDYPGQHVDVTIRAAEKLIPEFKAAGFGTFFVPQSEIGNFGQFMEGFDFALQTPDIDLIGVSILGCPNAFGVEKGNKLQRYLSRKATFDALRNRGALGPHAENRFHCLGMTDGPNEVTLLKQYHPYIFSWDSSAAFWAGAHGIRFDHSPTGLIDGKFEREVDFGFTTHLNGTRRKIIEENERWINQQCG